MSYDFNINVSNMIFHVTSNYGAIINQCGPKFLTKTEGEHRIIVDQKDIEVEREICHRENFGVDPCLLNAPDYHLEIIAVLRKIADYIVDFDRMLMHGSAICVDGKGYIFTAVSGTGKSTHTGLLRSLLGDRAVMINDDKPFLHVDKDQTYVCGTPWMGKHSLGENIVVPLAGIFFLHRSEDNNLTRIAPDTAISKMISQCHRPVDAEKMMKTLDLVDRVLATVPLYDFGCNMDISAAALSSSVMI